MNIRALANLVYIFFHFNTFLKSVVLYYISYILIIIKLTLHIKFLFSIQLVVYWSELTWMDWYKVLPPFLDFVAPCIQLIYDFSYIRIANINNKFAKKCFNSTLLVYFLCIPKVLEYKILIKLFMFPDRINNHRKYICTC